MLGVGSVEYRKGSDIFVDVYCKVKELDPNGQYLFVWLGDTRRDVAKQLSYYMKAHLSLSGCEDGYKNNVYFAGLVEQTDPFFQIADCLILPSRLDPLPGVVLEAISNNLPCVIFDKASGFPEFFRSSNLPTQCVAKYLDPLNMASNLIEILRNDKLSLDIKKKGKLMLAKHFSMDVYVKKIRELVKKSEGGFDSNEYKPVSFASGYFLRPAIFGLSDIPGELSSYSSEQIQEKSGGNTGNFAYTKTLLKIFKEPNVKGGWCAQDFNQASNSIGVLPLANQLGPHANLEGASYNLLSSKIHFVGFGLGAQIPFNMDGELKKENFYIPQHIRDWIEALIEKRPNEYPNISLRGEITQEVMDEYGYSNHCEVLGCPTLFYNLDERLGYAISERNNNIPEKICFAAGLPYWDLITSVEKQILKLVSSQKHFGRDIFVQSDIDMLRLALGRLEEVNEKTKDRLVEHYRIDTSSPHDFLRFFSSHCFTSCQIEEWLSYFREYDFVIGPRIHGVMMALQAGVPALCIPIDSRTLEMCEIMKVPYLKPKDFPKKLSRQDLNLVELTGFDPSVFDVNRKSLASKTLSFMVNNRLKPSLEFVNFAWPNSNK